MEIFTRRDFLRLSAVTAAGLAAGCRQPQPDATPATSPDFSPTPPVETPFAIPPSLEGKLVGENDPGAKLVEKAVQAVGAEASVLIASEPIRVGDRTFQLWDVYAGAKVTTDNGLVAMMPVLLTAASSDTGRAWVYTHDKQRNLYPIFPLNASLDEGYTYAPDTTKPAFVQAAVKTINGSTERYWASIVVDGVPTQKEEFEAAAKLFAEVKPDFNDPTTVKKLNQWLDTRWLSDFIPDPDVVNGVVSEEHAIVAAGNLASRLNRPAATGGSETVQDGNLVITDKKQLIGEARQLTLSLARVEEVAATHRSDGVTLINVKALRGGNVFRVTEKRLVYYTPTVVNALLKEVVWSDETGAAAYITKGSAVSKVVGQHEDGTHETIPVEGVGVDNLQIVAEAAPLIDVTLGNGERLTIPADQVPDLVMPTTFYALDGEVIPENEVSKWSQFGWISENTDSNNFMKYHLTYVTNLTTPWKVSFEAESTRYYTRIGIEDSKGIWYTYIAYLGTESDEYAMYVRDHAGFSKYSLEMLMSKLIPGQLMQLEFIHDPPQDYVGPNTPTIKRVYLAQAFDGFLDRLVAAIRSGDSFPDEAEGIIPAWTLTLP